MSKTANDRLFCLAVSCEKGLPSERLLYYMYMFQLAGFELNFRYSIGAEGLVSRDLSKYLNEIISKGVLRSENGYLYITEDISEIYCYLPITYSDLEIMDAICEIVQSLSSDELNLVCVVDYIIMEVTTFRGVDGLIKERESIEDVVSKLCSAYSKENFDQSIKLAENIKKGIKLC